jgi:hypothetical protein
MPSDDLAVAAGKIVTVHGQDASQDIQKFSVRVKAQIVAPLS